MNINVKVRHRLNGESVVKIPRDTTMITPVDDQADNHDHIRQHWDNRDC